MDNRQVRALALIAGFGLVLVKIVDHATAGDLGVPRGYLAAAFSVTAVGLTLAYLALQWTDDEKRFHMWEHWAMRVAVVIGFSLTLFVWFGH